MLLFKNKQKIEELEEALFIERMKVAQRDKWLEEQNPQIYMEKNNKLERKIARIKLTLNKRTTFNNKEDEINKILEEE